MPRKEELIKLMQDCKNEFERIKYRLDFTNLTEDEKVQYKQRKEAVKTEYAGHKAEYNKLVHADFMKGIKPE